MVSSACTFLLCHYNLLYEIVDTLVNLVASNRLLASRLSFTSLLLPVHSFDEHASTSSKMDLRWLWLFYRI